MSQKSQEKLENVVRNEIKQTKYQNLWDVAKIVHKGKFIGVKANIRKEGRGTSLVV